MKFFLDSNIIIYALKGTFPAIQTHMMGVPTRNIKVPAIVKAELLLGAEKSQSKKVLLAVETFLEPFEIVAFDQDACYFYAKIRSALEKKGTLIGPNDLIIASTVMLSHGCLVTHNTKEFARVKDLTLEDWTT